MLNIYSLWNVCTYMYRFLSPDRLGGSYTVVQIQIISWEEVDIGRALWYVVKYLYICAVYMPSNINLTTYLINRGLINN